MIIWEDSLKWSDVCTVRMSVYVCMRSVDKLNVFTRMILTPHFEWYRQINSQFQTIRESLMTYRTQRRQNHYIEKQTKPNLSLFCRLKNQLPARASVRHTTFLNDVSAKRSSCFCLWNIENKPTQSLRARGQWTWYSEINLPGQNVRIISIDHCNTLQLTVCAKGGRHRPSGKRRSL